LLEFVTLSHLVRRHIDRLDILLGVVYVSIV
jgi:hypothetical protein